MTREKVKALLPILTAYAEGKVIQLRVKQPDGSFVWIDGVGDISWYNYDDEYRIKPEPREFWIKKYKNQDDNVFWTFHLSKPLCSEHEETFRVREVI